MRKKLVTIGLLTMGWLAAWAQSGDVNTHRQYISGTGCDDMVQWDFQCTDGRNAGKWTKIGISWGEAMTALAIAVLCC